MKNENDSSVLTPRVVSTLNVYQRTQVKNEVDSSVSIFLLLSKLNVIR